jgi:hypothetical protein
MTRLRRKKGMLQSNKFHDIESLPLSKAGSLYMILTIWSRGLQKLTAIGVQSYREQTNPVPKLRIGTSKKSLVFES